MMDSNEKLNNDQKHTYTINIKLHRKIISYSLHSLKYFRNFIFERFPQNNF